MKPKIQFLSRIKLCKSDHQFKFFFCPPGGHKTNNNFSALDVNADDSLVCAGSEDHEDHEEVNLLLWCVI